MLRKRFIVMNNEFLTGCIRCYKIIPRTYLVILATKSISSISLISKMMIIIYYY